MIGIVGLGYVGLTSALSFHKLGEKIIGIDNNKQIVDNLNSGHLHIHDKKLDNYFKNNYQNITFSVDFNELSNLSDVFICVPTEGNDGELDLTIVNEVIKKLDNLSVRNIWIRSTIDKPEVFRDFNTSKSSIFSFPEFLREGKCWDDFFSPPLLVLGGNKITDTRVYKILKKNISEPSTCSCEEAITVKIACNAFHALKVVFANEIRNVQWNNLINVEKVMDIFSLDTKLNISPAYLKPGLPFGGPCLPKDTKALSNALFDSNINQNIFSCVINRNELVKEMYAKKIVDFNYDSIGFYGLEFKPGTGDLRNSPIIDIAKMVSINKEVFVFDENIKDKNIESNFYNCKSLEELKSKCKLIITYHKKSEQKYINWNSIII